MNAPEPPSSRVPWVVLLLVCAAAFAAAFLAWLRSRGGGAEGLWDVPRFELTDQTGQRFTNERLRGRVWAVDFVFTHCASICPTLGSRFVELRDEVPGITLVSISVDPERDTPERMLSYSKQHYQAEPGQWIWLTGEKEIIAELLQTGFKVGKPGPAAENDIPHSPHILLVDGRGRVRGTYVGTDREVFERRLLPDARRLVAEHERLAPIHRLPAVNAGLNGGSAVLLIVGFFLIRARLVFAHRICMLGACLSSALFLASYLTYHHFVGSVPFPGEGWIRPVYFTILISHTVLAALIVPLVGVTLFNAFTGRFERHRGIARWTLPLWLYVSVSGVAVYVLLYLLFPGMKL